ncbi:MAG: hypothetical protein ACHQYP_11195, partial [Nitrospiria bacterium]
PLRGDGEMSGGVVSLDGAAPAGRDLPGDVHPGNAAFPVAEAGDGGDVAGAGAAGKLGERACLITEVTNDVGEKAVNALNPGGPEKIGEIVNQSAGSEQNAESGLKQGSEAGRGTSAQG